MWVEDYKWHYDYIRLAWDTGFSFDKCKSPNLDKNKICAVDIDQIVRERDVASVDRFISTVIQYILDDDQAKVLDTNFVKIFRLSQLAVEFLLFCKKYLDNTVVLLKKELTKSREENKELQTFVNDLQTHIDTLTRQQVLATFKCLMCSKTFSSEEYLTAHIKRRHNGHNSESYNDETDKLNLEIKQLKEKLNSTEKLLKEKNEQSSEKIFRNFDNGPKTDELLLKFEHFKEKVDVELKELKTQKSFYEENYRKLFDIIISSKENIEPKNVKEILVAESTTQTDKLLHIENVHERNVLEIQECLPTNTTNTLVFEDNFKETKDNLEANISTTLAGIEDQMQTFWNKLNEIEKTKTTTIFQPDPRSLNQSENMFITENASPKIKPRSILSQPTHYNTLKTSNNVENLKLALIKLEQEQTFEQKKMSGDHKELQWDKNSVSVSKHHIPRITNILPKQIVNEDTIDSRMEEESSLASQASESEFVSIQKSTLLVKPPASIFKKQFIKSFNKLPTKKEVLKNLSKDIQKIVYSRIQELGISKSWSGLPQRTYEKSLEILNHQAALTTKTYSNFDLLKQKITQITQTATQLQKSLRPHVNK